MPADNIGLVIIQDARLSYPHLHRPQTQKSDDGSSKEKYSSGFLIEKARTGTMIGVHKGVKMPILKALKAAGDEARAAKWGDNPEKWPKLPPDRLYLRDGDIFKADKPEYVGHHFINSSANPENKPQVLTNRKGTDGKWIPAQPGQPGDPYGGCFVTAILAIWAQDNQYGKRLNCEVKTVQFFRDGEAFSGGIVDPNELLTDELAGITTGSLVESSESDDLI